MPAFLRSQAAIDEIEYLGPEPDRWRSRAEPELSAAQAPDTSLTWNWPMRSARCRISASTSKPRSIAAGQRPEIIGLQPWETDEVWERLKAAMRAVPALSWPPVRTPSRSKLRSFFLCRLARPLRRRRFAAPPRCREYNGWVGPNPNGYTTGHQIHHMFEGPFVAANMHAPDVQAKMTPAKLIDGDMFDAYVAYLRHTATYVEKVYQFEKAGGFMAQARPNRATSPLRAWPTAPACCAT